MDLGLKCSIVEWPAQNSTNQSQHFASVFPEIIQKLSNNSHHFVSTFPLACGAFDEEWRQQFAPKLRD